MNWRGDYPTNFVAAVDKVLKHEGFFSDDPDDPGGATKYGVSLRWLRTLGGLGDFDGDGDVDRDDVWAMTEAEAVRLYYERWWVQEGYNSIPGIAGPKVFDLAINMGPRPANRILQRSVRAASGTILVDDGVIGPNTMRAVGASDQHRLHVAIRSEAAGHYRLLIALRKSFEKYRRGWLNRAYA